MQPSATTQNQSFFSISPGFVKAATVTGLGVGTCALVFAAATATSGIAIAFFSVLAITAAAISIASITACFSVNSSTVDSYFSEVKSHLKVAIPAMWQFVAQKLVQALVQGIANGLQDCITGKISGRNVTRFAM